MTNAQFESVEASYSTIPQIQQLDFTMLKRKLMDDQEGEGWSLAQCDFAIEEYKRFLQIVLEFGNAVPNKIMDTVWHYHILDTRSYQSACTAIFGDFIHHYPYFGMNGEEDNNNLLASFEQTKQHYLLLFGEKLDRENGHFDNFEAGHCHKCAGRCSRCNNG